MGKGKVFTTSLVDDDFTSSSFEAPYIDVLGKKVRFSLKYCDTGKKHCISTFSSDKSVLADLYKQLGYYEDITWGVISGMPHEQGISIEKKDSTNHATLSSEYSDFDTFGHFRVKSKSKSKFRVFGARQSDLFYILRFDVDGAMNHK